MKSHYVQILKSQGQNLQKDFTSKAPKEIKAEDSPIKLEEAISSARNAKTGTANPQYVYEPVKSRSFVSSIISPSSRRPMVGGASSHETSINNNATKFKDKHRNNNNVEPQTATENPSTYKIVPSHHILSNYRDVLKNKLYKSHTANATAQKDSAKSSGENFSKKNNPSHQNQERGNMGNMYTAEKNNTLIEATSARKKSNPKEILESSPEPKAQQQITTFKAYQDQGKLNVKGSAMGISFNSPKRPSFDGDKPKSIGNIVVGSKPKNDYLLSRIISEHLKNNNNKVNNNTNTQSDSQYEDREGNFSTSASQNFKRGSFTKHSGSSVTNTNNTGSLLGVSSHGGSKRIESRSSKENSYVKDGSGSRLEDRRLLTSLSKHSKSPDELLNQKKVRERPDDSFEKHHLHSVRSVGLMKTPSPRNNGSFNSKGFGLGIDQIDANYQIEQKGRDERLKTDWNGLPENSKRNFVDFHRSFTENNAVSRSMEGAHLLSRLSKDGSKNYGEEKHTIQISSYLKSLEVDPMEKSSTLEALISPKSNKGPMIDLGRGGSSHFDENYYLLDVLKGGQASSQAELLLRRYPKTTKNSDNNNNNYRKGDFQNSIEMSMEGFRSRMLNESKETESTPTLHVNRSLNLSSNDKVNEFLKKARKNRTLINDEIEEKISQLEKKRIDLYTSYQKPENMKQLMSSKSEKQVVGRNIEEIDERTSLLSKKEEATWVPGLLGVFDRVRGELERSRMEKVEWMREKKEMMEKIEKLERRVMELEGKEEHSDKS